MRILLTLIFFISCIEIGLAKGGSGTYYIVGKAYSKEGILLKNALIQIKGGFESNIKTDSDGNYEIAIRWETVCRSGQTRIHSRIRERRINPKRIILFYSKEKIVLKNQWKKYRKFWDLTKDEKTWKIDLHFN